MRIVSVEEYKMINYKRFRRNVLYITLALTFIVLLLSIVIGRESVQDEPGAPPPTTRTNPRTHDDNSSNSPRISPGSSIPPIEIMGYSVVPVPPATVVRVYWDPVGESFWYQWQGEWRIAQGSAE